MCNTATFVYVYINVYRVSGNCRVIFHEHVERIKLNRKVLYCFAIFAIVNKRSINKDRRMSTNVSRCEMANRYLLVSHSRIILWNTRVASRISMHRNALPNFFFTVPVSERRAMLGYFFSPRRWTLVRLSLLVNFSLIIVKITKW